MSHFLSTLILMPIIFFASSMMKPAFDFEGAWAQVEKLKEERKDQSALHLVNDIYIAAIDEQKGVHIVRSVKFSVENGALIDTLISKLESDLKKLDSPVKEVATLQLASLYQNYLQANQYKISQRTSLVGNDFPNDIKLYTIDLLNEKIRILFQKALENRDKTEIPLDDYHSVLTFETDTELKDFTLFEIILHHYSNHLKSRLINDQSQKLNTTLLFAPFEQFVKYDESTLDPKSIEAQIIKVQKIEGSLANSNDRKQTFYTIRRLETWKNFLGESVDELYSTALGNLMSSSQNSQTYPFIVYSWAQFQLSKNSSDRRVVEDVVSILKKTITSHPEGLGIKAVQSLVNQLEQEQFSVAFEYTYIPGRRIEYQITHRNLSAVHLRLVPLNENQINTLKDYRLTVDQKLEQFKNATFLEQWSHNLSLSSYIDSSENYMGPAISGTGSYGVIISKDADFSTIEHLVNLTISNISFSIATLNQPFVMVRKRSDGAPIKKATVEVFERKYDNTKGQQSFISLGKYRTDGEGNVTLSQVNKQIFLKITHKKDTYTSDHGNYIYSRSGSSDNVYSEDVFYTDRAIYRPGQRVYFKVITLSHQQNLPSIRPKAVRNIKVLDANQQVIQSFDNATANDFGSYSSSFQIPNTGLTGHFTIQTDHGALSFLVQDYKRPTFEILVDSLYGGKDQTDTVSLEATIKGYAGNMLGGVDYSVKVVRYINTPRCYFWFPPMRRQETLIASTVGKTDDVGRIIFNYAADNPVFPFPTGHVITHEITITVTDQAGETQEIVKSHSISPQEFFLRITGEDQLDVTTGPELKIEAFDANSTSLNLSGSVKLYLLPKSNTTTFPWDEQRSYRPIPNGTVEIDLTGAVLIRETPMSFPSVYRTGQVKSGTYAIVAESINSKGEVVKTSKKVTVVDFRRSDFSAGPGLFSSISSDIAKVGETITLTLGTNGKIYTDIFILKGEKLELYDLVRIKNTYTVEIPVLDKHRGGFSIYVNYVENNRVYRRQFNITVPFTNKNLEVIYKSFRDLTLPGGKEKYEIELKAENPTDLESEILVSMYDASLDAFVKQTWRKDFYHQNYGFLNFYDNFYGLANVYTRDHVYDNFDLSNNMIISIPRFSFGQQYITYMDGDMVMVRGMSRQQKSSMPAPEALNEVADEENISMEAENAEINEDNEPTVALRENLNETVFFYPHLQSSKDGSLSFEFTMNEALTKWKMLTFAHSKSFVVGYDERTVVTQKKLMIRANPPRLLRLGDELWLTANVSNLTDQILVTKAGIKVNDFITEDDINHLIKSTRVLDLELKPGETKAVSWLIDVSDEKLQAGLLELQYYVQGDGHEDGESHLIPLLSQEVEIVKSLPFSLRGGETKALDFDVVSIQNSSGKNLSYTFEMAIHPGWFALQALGNNIDKDPVTTPEILDKWKAIQLSLQLLKHYPEISEILKAQQAQGEEFVNKLMDNQDLKSLLLESTPWVIQAIQDKEGANALFKLLDKNSLESNLEQLFRELMNRKVESGGFTWYKEGIGNESITSSVINGLEFDVLNKEQLGSLNGTGEYLTRTLTERYFKYIRNAKDSTLYIPSKMDLSTIEALMKLRGTGLYTGESSEAELYILDRARKTWNQQDDLTMLVVGNIMHKADKSIAEKIKDSFIDRLKSDKELGRFLDKYNNGGSIVIQGKLLKFLNTMGVKDDVLDEMKIWLIHHKNGNTWGNRAVTIEAVEALLASGSKTQTILKSSEYPKVTIGSHNLDMKEAGAAGGYIRKDFDLTSGWPFVGMNKVSIQNTDTNVMYGSLYLKSLVPMDSVVSLANTPLTIQKALFVKTIVDKKEILKPITSTDLIKVGDVVVSRLIINSERALDFIHIQDFRGAGLEPASQISAYEYKEGLGYYKEIRDGSTNYFINHLPKGTSVLEVENRATFKGNFSGGFARVQSQYAQEFVSMSNGVRILVN